MSVRSLAGGSVAKILPAMQKTQVRSLGWEERQWQPTPVFLLRKIHGQRSLAGYSPWGCNKLGMPECLSKHALSVTVYYIKCMKQAWFAARIPEFNSLVSLCPSCWPWADPSKVPVVVPNSCGWCHMGSTDLHPAMVQIIKTEQTTQFSLIFTVSLLQNEALVSYPSHYLAICEIWTRMKKHPGLPVTADSDLLSWEVISGGRREGAKGGVDTG